MKNQDIRRLHYYAINKAIEKGGGDLDTNWKALYDALYQPSSLPIIPSICLRHHISTKKNIFLKPLKKDSKKKKLLAWK